MDEAVALATDLAHPHTLAFAWAYAASLAQILGDPAGAIECADRSLGVAIEHASMATIDEALGVTTRSGCEAFYAPELHRPRGELVLSGRQTGDDPGAEVSLRRALELARLQQAKSLELRAATSLGRLWERQVRRNEARALNVQVCDSFTDGFETRDLEEARSWLGTASPA